jgi:hypothetical protein
VQRAIPVWMRWSLLGVKPPSKDASRPVRLRFVRDLNARFAVLLAPVALLIVLLASTTWAIVSLVAFALLVIDVVYLTLKLRHTPSQ